MSDLEDSTVTYTEVSSLFEGLSDIGSSRIEGPPMMPEDPYAYVVAAFQAPPSPDYVPGSKVPEQAPPLLEFEPEPIYLQFMPPEDEILLVEEQPLPVADSPTADSSGYILESDPEEDPKEDDKDPEEDPTDYLADKDDDADEEEEEESSGDEADDKKKDEDEDEDEEEEHRLRPTLSYHFYVGTIVRDCRIACSSRIRQTQLAEALALLKTLQTQVAALQRRRGPARGPTQHEAPEEAENGIKRTTRSTPATTTTTTTTVTDAQLKALIDQGVSNALAARDADRSQNGKDSHDSRMGVRRQALPVHECTYQHFMKCKPLYFKGTKGVVELTQWFERMETMFCISNCTVEKQIKFATWTFQEGVSKTEEQQLRQPNWKWQCSSESICGRPCRDNPDSNVVMGTFLLNNRYASILFDTCGDRSFVSTIFSSHSDITPTALDRYYDVELADGRIIGLNTILRGCILNFVNHPFNIDLMSIELGSFDVIIGMDWLGKYQTVIVCAKKIVRIPWGNETLIVRGDGSDRGTKTRLNIISCTKSQKYMLKGCHVFLAHVTTKETEDKSKKKRLEDVPIIRDFLEVFHEEFLARAPYRLAPSKMKEFADQLKELSDKGFIRPSSSPWGAPILFVKKKDGSFQMCNDYR
nr:putative reverse transcriptase domain-containing protein [Tanacetum cinerariifolium]